MTDAIRPARDGEAAACRMMLPAAFPATGAAPELFVAPGPEGIRGAVAIAWVPKGFSVLVQVAAPWRRQGIGSALIEAAAASALGETAALRAWMPVSEGSIAAAFLQTAGFRIVRRLLVFETDSVHFGLALNGLLRRAQAGGRVSRQLTLATLAAAPVQGVVDLVAPEFATLPHDLAAQMAPDNHDGYDRALSLVLLHDGAVVGAMLCRRFDDLVEIDVNVVVPTLRHGMANLILLEGMARMSQDAGIRRIRFSCEEHVRDTLNLGRRAGAIRMPNQLLFARSL
jgi:GNAT superfamily N-acetyltransferase